MESMQRGGYLHVWRAAKPLATTSPCPMTNLLFKVSGVSAERKSAILHEDFYGLQQEALSFLRRRGCSNNYGISTLANKDWKVCAEALMSDQIHVVSPQSSSHFLCHHQNEWLTTPAIPIIPPTAATNGSRLVLEVFGRFFSPLRMLLGTRSFLFLGKSGGFRGVRGRRRQESEQTFGRFLPSSHN